MSLLIVFIMTLCGKLGTLNDPLLVKTFYVIK